MVQHTVGLQGSLLLCGKLLLYMTFCDVFTSLFNEHDHNDVAAPHHHQRNDSSGSFVVSIIESM